MIVENVDIVWTINVNVLEHFLENCVTKVRIAIPGI